MNPARSDGAPFSSMSAKYMELLVDTEADSPPLSLRLMSRLLALGGLWPRFIILWLAEGPRELLDPGRECRELPGFRAALAVSNIFQLCTLSRLLQWITVLKKILIWLQVQSYSFDPYFSYFLSAGEKPGG